MSLSSLSVKRGVTFSMIFIVMVGFGLFSLSRLRLDLYPDLSFPLVVVVTQYQGAGPHEIEDLVSRPLEGALASVEGAKEVSSTSKQNVSLVSVEFDWGADLNQAEIDVRKSIDLIRSRLPEDVQDPIVFAMDPALQPVIFLGIAGPFTKVKLREITEEKIEPLLERVPGIAMADTVGGGKREIQVRLDPRRLGAAGIAPQQVVTALRLDNVLLPGGTFDQGGWEFTIQAQGRFNSVSEIEEVVVGVQGTVPLRVRDVAEVVDGLKEETRLVRNNGKGGVLTLVRKQSDANTVQVVRAVKHALPEIERQAGRGIKLNILFDQGEIVEKSVGNLGSTATYAIILAFFVLLFFLRNVRPSLVVAASIPFSVIVTFSVMDALGLTLNIISMSGLALAIGMLVDNSIVVQESIFLRAEEGVSPREAAVAGATEVKTAITASTLTTLVVFLPILFVPGIAGMMFRDMTLTVCVALLVSLGVALTAVPLAASRLLRRQMEGTARPPGPLVRVLAWLYGHLERVYVSHLGWCLRNRKKTFLLVSLLFIGVMALGRQLAVQFFPKQDMGMVVMQMDLPLGSSLERTDEAFRRMEQLVFDLVPERRAMNVDIGSGEGFVALFAKGSHSGLMRLKLKDQKDRIRSQAEIEELLRDRFSKIPGLKATVFHPDLFGSGGDIVVKIYGHDLVEAHRVGLAVKELIEGIAGTADVVFSQEAGKPEYDVVLDRSRMAALGLNTATVASAIETIFSGRLASIYQEGGYEYDIRVRGPKSFRRDERNLRALPITTPTGATVPLSAVSTITPGVGPATIARQDQQRMVTVTASVPGKNLGKVVQELSAKLKRFRWPDGFTYHIGGEAEDMQDSFRWLGIALVVAILLVYMVMASQFESLLHPFVILFAIPLAFIGVVLILLMTGTSLSVSALIGVLILGGIVVNNAIVFVDFTNQRRAAGVPLDEAVLQAGRRRLRPILMTAGTTALSMLPLALELGEGAEGWSPMARVVIGGLLASTGLTLLVIPSLYLALEKFRERRRQRRAAAPGTSSAAS